MPNHRSVLFLAALSWIAGVALAAQSWLAEGLDLESVRSHLTTALAILVSALLSHTWVFLYGFGVRRELLRRPELVIEEARSGAILAGRAQHAGLVALLSLMTLAGLGLAVQLGWFDRRTHGIGSSFVLVVLVVCLAIETPNLERLRRLLLRLEAQENRS